MSRRPFDPSELDQPVTGIDQPISELERYVDSTATDAPRGLSDRVMAAIEHEPAPRRGLIAFLLTPPAAGGGMQRFARVGVMAATLVLAVAGALFAGQLASLVRDFGSGGTPTPSPSPSLTESVSPSPSPSLDASPSALPSPSGDASSSAPATGSPQATPNGTEGPSESETDEESETPRPSAATPSPTLGS
jgi:hypothetical protein